MNVFKYQKLLYEKQAENEFYWQRDRDDIIIQFDT